MTPRPARPFPAAWRYMEDYEAIFLGYPIWWGDAPKIISTFLETYDFDGKTIVPFCTSGSSSIGGSVSDLEALTSGAAWLDASGSAAPPPRRQYPSGWTLWALTSDKPLD